MTTTRQGDNLMTIKQTTKLLTLLLSLTLLLTLTACGGGGGGGDAGSGGGGGGGITLQAQKVTVTLGLQGNAAATVGSVDLNVLLPTGFVLEIDGTAQPTAAAMTLLVPGATTAANYTPATTAANGEIKAGIIKTEGFAGNAVLLQISRTYAAGATLPTAGDFMVTVIASDLNGIALTGISTQISINTQSVP
jgi:hypothetical protein